MTLIKRDIVNPNKMEVVTVEQALNEAMHIAALGYVDENDRIASEHKELKQIVGRLLNSLSEKKVLTDHGINGILNCHTITVGQAYDPK